MSSAVGTSAFRGSATVLVGLETMPVPSNLGLRKAMAVPHVLAPPPPRRCDPKLLHLAANLCQSRSPPSHYLIVPTQIDRCFLSSAVRLD